MIRWLLVAVAVAGMGYAWVLFPAENEYSIMTHTISFLGSPDADRNPPGWHYYQVGMTAAIMLLLVLAAGRKKFLRPKLGKVADWTYGVTVLAFSLMLLSVWIPDARSMHWRGVRLGEFHNAIVIPGILILMMAIVMEGVFVGRSGCKGATLWVYRGFGILFLVGLTSLFGWEVYCARTPGVVSWPGVGICSTPLWEWMLFAYLLGFSFYLNRPEGDSVTPAVSETSF